MADTAVTFLGLSFRNPVLPGAGPHVGSGEAMAEAAAAGAGGLVSHTVTPRPAAAGPRPVESGRGTLLNADLFTGLPLDQWVDHEFPLALVARGVHRVPVIGSVGYGARDLAEVGPALERTGVDALEWSMHLLAAEGIETAARTLREAVRIPIIAKLSPQAGDLVDLARRIDPYVDAFTVMNSVGPVLRIDIERGGAPLLGTGDGFGWMTGAAIKPIVMRWVYEIARTVKKPIIASGGVRRGVDVIDYLMIGASLVEVATQVIVEGNAAYARIAREAADWLDAHGYRSFDEIRGRYLGRFGRGQRVVTTVEEVPKVDPALCIGCTLCERSCFYDAIEAPPRVVAKVTPEPCFQCGLCVSVCPTQALTFRPREGVTMYRPGGSSDGQ